MERILLIFRSKNASEQKESDPDLLKVLFCKDSSNNKYGFLYVSEYSEKLDNHCEQCKYERPLFFGLKGGDGFPNYFAADIGPTKYQRILNKEIDMNTVEILFDLLEQ